MSDNEPLLSTELEAIRRSLEDTGYLLEHQVHRSFQDRGYNVFINSLYDDADLSKKREMDVVVRQSTQLEVPTATVWSSVRSQRPSATSRTNFLAYTRPPRGDD